MADVEAAIRNLINHDQDCAEASYRLIAMRAQVAELVGQWRAASGGERLPTIPERLSRDRPQVERPKRTERSVAARSLSRWTNPLKQRSAIAMVANASALHQSKNDCITRPGTDSISPRF